MGKEKKELLLQFSFRNTLSPVTDQLQLPATQSATTVDVQWLLQLSKAEQFISASGNNTEGKGSQISFLSTAVMKYLGSTYSTAVAQTTATWRSTTTR